MQRKFFALMLALTLVLGTVTSATADTRLNPNENRGIVLQPVTDNVVEDGYSPTTGRKLSSIRHSKYFTGLAATGRYTPMQVTVSNSGSGIAGRASWGAYFADVIYELPLYRKGDTRMAMIFSDLIPDSVGPVRSARLANVWIREEWDGILLFLGQQTYAGTNVLEEFTKVGLGKDAYGTVLFSGISIYGKSYEHYYSARAGVAAPNDMDVMAAAISQQIPLDYTPKINHAYLFTDETLQGDSGTIIQITQGTEDREYDSLLQWDATENAYLRYCYDFKNNWAQTLYVDRDTTLPVTFNNVIIQFADVQFPAFDAPVANMVGEGNADFFMNGKHQSGYWKRESMNSRTVFYGADGNEMPMQRGRTLIVVIGRDMADRWVTYR